MYDIVYINQSDNLSGYDRLTQQYPHAMLLDSYSGIVDVLQLIKKLCYTNMVWLVSDNWTTDSGNILSWRPFENDKIVYWSSAVQTMRNMHSIKLGDSSSLFNGSYLLPLNYECSIEEQHTGKLTDISVVAGENPCTQPFDIFFVSYNEPNADANWERLSSKYPNAKRVHGIKGIHNAHRRCAELSYTSMFWTVDGDTIIDDDFEFDRFIPIYDMVYLHLWYSRNPVNGLAYGYGAVKLWPTTAVIEFDKNWLDFTTSVGNIKIVDEVIATSAFNTDVWSAWRSGFREAVKLCVNVANSDDDESLQRLLVWLTVTLPVDYAVDTRSGAIDGVEFYLASLTIDDLKIINDFDKLQILFDSRVSRIDYDSNAERVLTLLKAHTLV
jgi:hypothetical protein